MLSAGVSVSGFRIFSTLRETPAGAGANISNAPLYGGDDSYVGFIARLVTVPTLVQVSSGPLGTFLKHP
jgi:hypothetical protein